MLLNEQYELLKKFTKLTSINDNYITGIAQEQYYKDFKTYTVILENNQPVKITCEECF